MNIQTNEPRHNAGHRKPKKGGTNGAMKPGCALFIVIYIIMMIAGNCGGC